MTLQAAVAVATLRRPLRLRWLLNALAEQDADPGSFEIVVAHDPACEETAHVLRSHRLTRSGSLRAVTFPAASRFPGAGRNAAWRASDAPLVLFTDDDCVPAGDWVSRALAVAEEHENAILQGTTLPDPAEGATLVGAPWVQTIKTRPPTGWAEACNIAYPRELLDRLGGFDPRMRVGEDTELWMRARAAGAALRPVPEMLVFHAVHEQPLPAAVRAAARWRDFAWLVKRHPDLRRQLPGRLWWKREHAALSLGLAGAALAPRDARCASLLVPWLALTMVHRGYGARGLARAASELPGRLVIDVAEVVTMLRGSARYRTLVL